jgi:2,4-didehydro-3-deoxy-L-rhamnonate hydrolase
MRIGNLAGRLQVFRDGGAVDVEENSDGWFLSDPQAMYPRLDEFYEWAQRGLGDPEPFDFADLQPAQLVGVTAW